MLPILMTGGNKSHTNFLVDRNEMLTEIMDSPSCRVVYMYYQSASHPQKPTIFLKHEMVIIGANF